MSQFLSRGIPQLLILSLLLFVVHAQCLAKDEVYVEEYETGQKKVEYKTRNGKPYGDHTEYFVGGQVRVKAKYKAGKLDGDYIVYHGDGKKKIHMIYKRGLRHGPYVEMDNKGKLLATGKYVRGKLDGPFKTYTRGKTDRPIKLDEGELVVYRGKQTLARPLEDITATFRKLSKLKTPDAELVNKEQMAAIRRLYAYRYLSGLSDEIGWDRSVWESAAYEAEELDGSEAEVAETNDPRNHAVRLPEGKEAPNMFAGIDALMADNQAPLEEGLSRRRLCLSPHVSLIGIERREQFVVLATNNSKSNAAGNWQMIAHPAPGYTPVDFFSADRPWTFILNHKMFRSVIKQKTIQIRPIGDNLRLGKAIKLSHRTQTTLDEFEPDAPPHHLFIMQPEEIDISAGKRYWVQIAGLQRTRNNDLGMVEFLVEFTEPIDLTKPVKRKKKKRSSRKK